MYKILLADEEGVALEALRVMVDGEFGEDCDIRLAVNTQQMFDIFSKFLPDIIFVNVQMAGMHGIASIRELHTKQKKCLFHIISYTKRIDFGREGANMGIQSYTPKPLKHDKVRQLLRQSFALVDYEQKHAEIERYNKQQWDEAIPMLESGLISELIYPDQNDRNFQIYRTLLNIKGDYGYLMELKYSEITEHGTMCNPIGSMIQLQNSNIYFRKIIKAFFPSAIIGPILGNHLLILIPLPSRQISEESRQLQVKRAEDMTYQLHRKLSLRFRFGQSQVHLLNDLIPAITEARADLESY